MVCLALGVAGSGNSNASETETRRTSLPSASSRVPTQLSRALASECTTFAANVGATDVIVDPVAKVGALRPIAAELAAHLDALRFPPDLAALRMRLRRHVSDASKDLATANTASSATAAFAAFMRDIDAAGLTLLRAGVPCLGNPAGLRSAAVNIPVEGDAWVVTAAFGDLWVSEKYLGRIVRIDPRTGRTLARIDVSPNPAKAYPADGFLWVRTQADMVQIDPSTNHVVQKVPKSRFGQAVQRTWVVDGAMWLCDGSTLVRVDPVSLRQVARLTLDFPCFEVYARGDTVLAWSNDNAPTESGREQIAIIDPARNVVRSSLRLPVDIGLPAIVRGRAFFVGDGTAKIIVVDLDRGSVVATRELSAPAAGGVLLARGSLWVPTADVRHVVQVDPETLRVVRTINPAGVAAIAFTAGKLWTVVPDPLNLLEGFDINGSK